MYGTLRLLYRESGCRGVFAAARGMTYRSSVLATHVETVFPSTWGSCLGIRKFPAELRG